MWREYTRETPARPGLALVSTIIAFSATCGLAWYLTNAPRHLGPGAPTMHSIRLSRWPIAFAIPDGYERTRSHHEKLGGFLLDGPAGDIQFVTTEIGLNRIPVILEIHYLLMESSVSIGNAFDRMTNVSSDGAESIELGSIPAMMALALDGGTPTRLIAAGCTRDGLGIAVEMTAPRIGPREKREFFAVCASIELKTWTQPNDSTD